MFTRQQCLNDEVTHRDYYAQFVTDSIKALVHARFSTHILKNAGDHFNEISLRHWDILTYSLPMVEINTTMKQCEDFYTLSGGVCILKEAARQLCEETE